MRGNISERKCLTNKCWDIIHQKKLKIHLYQTILGDKFSTKNVEQNPSPNQFRKKPPPKRFCLVEIFWYYLVEISPSIILVEIELSKDCWQRFLFDFYLVEISLLRIFFWKFLFRICWWKTWLKECLVDIFWEISWVYRDFSCKIDLFSDISL